MSLEESRLAWSKTIVSEGGICPCCDRWGKIYGRNLNETMAESLKWLYDASVDCRWVDVPNTAPKSVVRSNQLPTLRWWGLVERQGHQTSNKKHSGMWSITKKGVDFVHGKIEIPSKVFTYNGEVVGYGMEMTNISSCVGVQFDYDDMMNSRTGDDILIFDTEMQ